MPRYPRPVAAISRKAESRRAPYATTESGARAIRLDLFDAALGLARALVVARRGLAGALAALAVVLGLGLLGLGQLGVLARLTLEAVGLDAVLLGPLRVGLGRLGALLGARGVVLELLAVALGLRREALALARRLYHSALRGPPPAERDCHAEAPRQPR